LGLATRAWKCSIVEWGRGICMLGEHLCIQFLASSMPWLAVLGTLLPTALTAELSA
jgi:hypothetical protein